MSIELPAAAWLFGSALLGLFSTKRFARKSQVNEVNKLLVILCALILPATTNAAIYRYDLSGVITYVSNLPIPIAVGDFWSYSITVNGDTPDSARASDQGFYRNSITEVLFQSGSVELGSILHDESALVVVNNDRPTNAPHDSLLFDVRLYEEYVGDWEIAAINVDLYDWTAGAISSDNLSETLAVEVNDFAGPFGTNEIEISIGANGNIYGEVTSYSASVIPIPTAAWLFGSAVLAIGALKRKVTRNTQSCS
jgi:hypothetical protein